MLREHVMNTSKARLNRTRREEETGSGVHPQLSCCVLSDRRGGMLSPGGAGCGPCAICLVKPIPPAQRPTLLSA